MDTLDAIDKKILNLLQKEARTTIKEVAAVAGITPTPAYERIKRLERSGFIKGYVALLDKDLVGRNLTVFCQVSLKSHTTAMIEEFEAHVQKLPEVMECYHTAGNFDYLLKVMVQDMEAYQRFIVSKLSTTQVMSNIQSVFVMKDIKQELAFELQEKK
jgi:Lrp/AsnC family transcriptional regulator, leucine-responsive regulatory protein